MTLSEHCKGLLALSPVALLLGVYIAMSLVVGDFYRISIGVAFVVAAIYGIAITRGEKLQSRISVFSQGAANSDIIYMVWIFVLAGIFASSAEQMGAVDTTVAMTIRVVPAEFLPAGIFLASCFISMSIGTSVGTIVALTPIVTGLAGSMGGDVAWAVAIVVGGAFFGDNLSFISDTTIAATQSQGCRMSDKFRTNLLIVLPAAIFAFALYLMHSGSPEQLVAATDIEWYKALPYIIVIVCALLGVNVLMVLVIGIVASDMIGLASGSLDIVALFEAAGKGINSMSELIVVTMLAGGLMGIVKHNGGFDYLINALTARVRGRRGAEAVITLLTALTNLCTANNTIAIVTVGPIARDIAERYGVPARKSASLMDTASCFVQGLLPYGAQLLMASGLVGISPLEIVPHLYYSMAIGVMVALSIVLQYPRIKRK